MSDESKYIEQLALGSHKAFRFIFMKYYPKMKYFIAHIVKSEAVAEDLSQEVFEKIWMIKEDLPKLKSFNAYIYRMSKNIAINYIERKYIERTYVDNYEVERDFLIDDVLEAKDIEMLVLMEVENMPNQRKRIFELSRYENLKNEEIAEQLNISKKTVENHLNLALNQLRKAIKGIYLFFL